MTGLLIREFEPGDEAAFRSLNVEWIERYFRLEAPDEAVLCDPRGAILDAGGRIFLAVLAGRPVGCCALIRVHSGEFEVAKMAVTASAQGAGIGRALLTAAIEAARLSGAHRLCLETNSVLGPAIRLYESLGFQHIPADCAHPSAYARCDVTMELMLRTSPSGCVPESGERPRC